MPNDDIVRTSKTKEEEQREGDGEVQKDEVFSRRETAKLGSMVEKALEKDLERQSR